MRNFKYHKELAAGGWQRFNLMEQMANIGSEVGRARKWQGKDENLFQGAIERALELFDLTLEDPRWKGRLREIARAREIFLDAALGIGEYQTTLEDLDRYFSQFAFASQARR